MIEFLRYLREFLNELRIFLSGLDEADVIILIVLALGVAAIFRYIKNVSRSIASNVLTIITLVAVVFCIGFGLAEEWVPLAISAVIACGFAILVIVFDRIFPALSKEEKEKFLSGTDNDVEKPKQGKEKPKENKEGFWEKKKREWQQAMEEAQQGKEGEKSEEKKKGPWEQSKEKPKQKKDD